MKAIKKGQVGVITTVVLLVVALVAVSIFWLTTRGLLIKQTEQLTTDCTTITLSLNKLIGTPFNNVTVRRDVGVADLVNLIVYVNNKENNKTGGTLNQLEYRELKFVTPATVVTGDKVSVAPVVKGPSGNEILCPMADSVIVERR